MTDDVFYWGYIGGVVQHKFFLVKMNKSIAITLVALVFVSGLVFWQYSTVIIQSIGGNNSRFVPSPIRYSDIDVDVSVPSIDELHERSVLITTSSDKNIDLDVSVPSIDELYDRLVLITAFSDNHYKEAMGYIGTAQKYMPGKRIVVYDLGLPTKKQHEVKRLCNVELRMFNFNDYPQHVSDLHTYAWKAIIINLALNEFGAVYYGDAAIRFKESLKVLLPGIERHYGYMTCILNFNPTDPNFIHHYQLTVPKMFIKLSVDRDEYRDCINCAPHIQPGTQLIINSTTIQTKLMQPWLQCAMEKECIAPTGSSRANHRQDASAITLLVYKNLFGEWTVEDNDTKKMQAVVAVRRSTDGFQHHPQYCVNDKI
ncbi:uncharacterized protein [Apostichopus japonicus]|uniref:uncharacterized protein isoform X3 n=2 Tax=Stichopus japonicus TaxID=307972 RepID=UPI003AB8C31B